MNKTKIFKRSFFSREVETTNKDFLEVEVPPLKVNVSMCSEDNKLPSDESFQNYTNGLDFSTNLFDTDRISSLDISGNSRSDNDFNPYSIDYKDENVLTNDLDFPINCENPSKEVGNFCQQYHTMFYNKLSTYASI